MCTALHCAETAEAASCFSTDHCTDQEARSERAERADCSERANSSLAGSVLAGVEYLWKQHCSDSETAAGTRLAWRGWNLAADERARGEGQYVDRAAAVVSFMQRWTSERSLDPHARQLCAAALDGEDETRFGLSEV